MRLLRLLIIVAAIVFAAYLLLLRSEGMQDRVLDAAIERRVAADRVDLLNPEAMNVVFCGTGSPIPDPARGNACIAVFVGDRVFLVDAGGGAWERIARLRLPTGKLAGVLFTHFHSDHIGGLGDVVLNSWAQGRSEPLHVYGGPGIEDVARGVELSYAHDSAYRIAHHGEKLLPPSGAKLVAVPLTSEDPAAVMPVIDDGNVRIVAFRVKHTPVEPAYGYRIDYKGRSAVFSGDTMYTPSMGTVGKGVDVMVHEALQPMMMEKVAARLEAIGDPRRGQLLRDAITYHTPPVEAAKAANEAGARLLVFSHVIPPPPNRIAERILLRGVDAVRSDGVMLAYDGLELSLPVGSTAIVPSDLR
jgi:ribonuclease Z